MKKSYIFPLFLLLLVAVTGCTANVYMEKYVPEEADTFVRKFIKDVKTRKFSAARAVINPKFRTPELEDLLDDVADKLDHGKIVKARLVKFDNVRRHPFTSEIKRNYLTYEVELEDGWAEVQTLVDAGEAGKSGRNIHGFFIKPLPSSMKELNAIDFEGSTSRHYFFLFLALAVPAFIIYVAVLCLRSAEEKKIRWFILILLGLGSLTFNWTTGDISYGMLRAQFLGVEPLRDGLDGPLLLTIGMPLGAILFFFRYRKHYRDDIWRG